MRVVVEPLDGGVLDGAIHAFDLAGAHRVVGFRQAMVYAGLATDPVKRMRVVRAGAESRPHSSRHEVGELKAVFGEHGVDPIGDEVDQSVANRTASSLASSDLSWAQNHSLGTAE